MQRRTPGDRPRLRTLCALLAFAASPAIAQPDPSGADAPTDAARAETPAADALPTPFDELRRILVSASNTDTLSDGRNRYLDWIVVGHASGKLDLAGQYSAARVVTEHGTPTTLVDWFDLTHADGKPYPERTADAVRATRTETDQAMRDAGIYDQADTLVRFTLPVIPLIDGRGHRSDLQDHRLRQSTRSLARAMRLRYVEALQRGDHDEMEAALRVVGSASQASAREPGMLAMLNANVVAGLGLRLMVDDALDDVEGVDLARPAPVHRAQRIDRSLAALENYHEPRIRFAMRTEGPLSAAIAPTRPTDEERRLVQSTFDALAVAIEQGRPKDVQRVLDDAQAFMRSNTDPRFEFASASMIVLPSVHMSYRRGALDRRATEALLRIERYRLEHRRLPETLEDADASFTDPYDPNEGPLRYRVMDRVAHRAPGQGYLLYSVGYDGEDNNGAMGGNRFHALMHTSRGDELDYVVNRRVYDPDPAW